MINVSIIRPAKEARMIYASKKDTLSDIIGSLSSNVKRKRSEYMAPKSREDEVTSVNERKKLQSSLQASLSRGDEVKTMRELRERKKKKYYGSKGRENRL